MVARAWPQHMATPTRPKRRFTAEADAWAWLTRRGLDADVYRCGLCGDWHLAAVYKLPPRVAEHRQQRAEQRRLDRERARRVKEDLERRRLARRLATRNAREAWIWQQVIT